MSVEGYELLPGAVAAHVARGYRVEAAPVPGQVVMGRGRRPNHILHLLLSVVTVGLWLPVWLLVAATTREHRIVLSEESARRAAVPRPAARPWWQQRDLLVAVAVVVVFMFVSATDY